MTNTLPKEEGYYWVILKDKNEPEIVELVDFGTGHLRVYFIGTDTGYTFDNKIFKDSLWSDRIFFEERVSEIY